MYVSSISLYIYLMFLVCGHMGAGPAWAGVGQALVGLPGLAGDCLGWWGGWDFKDGRSNTEGVGQALVGGKSH